MATGKNGKVQLPKGFTAITGGGNSHDFKKEKTLQGVLVGVKKVTQNKGKKDERTVRLAIIRKADGTETAVWESAGNRALFDVKKGKKVFIALVGMKKLPGRKQPMKDFVVAVA